MSKYFHISELRCKDKKGTPVPKEYRQNAEELLQNLDVLREELGVPVIVHSGYRTPEHNKAVGGKPNSYHMKAMAGDLVTKYHNPRFVYDTIERLIREKKMKQGGLGLYSGFVHYDIRGRKARW